MRFFKIFILSLLSIVFLLPSIAFAEDNRNIDNLLKSLYLKDSDDSRELKNISKSSLRDIKETIDYSKSMDNKSGNTPQLSNLSFNENNCFKVFRLNNPDFVKEFKNNRNFERNISEDYNWIYPIYEDRKVKHAATFSKVNNTWDMSGFIEDINPNMIHIFANGDNIKEILEENNIKTPSNIKFVRIDQYHINIIYVKQDNKEYAIPFTNATLKMGINNGQMYEISNLVDKLSNESIIKETSKDRQGGGQESSGNTLKAVGLVTMILSGSLFIIINFKKK